MSARQILARLFAEPPRPVVQVRRQVLWCSLCYAISTELNLDMPDDDGEAVAIVDGNTSCHEHLDILRGRSVTEALNVLRARAT